MNLHDLSQSRKTVMSDLTFKISIRAKSILICLLLSQAVIADNAFFDSVITPSIKQQNTTTHKPQDSSGDNPRALADISDEHHLQLSAESIDPKTSSEDLGEAELRNIQAVSNTSSAQAKPKPDVFKHVFTKENKKSVREIPFVDNEQIQVTLSNKDINRISVKKDKITTINAPAGLCVVKNDNLGSAYINVYGDDPFTIFASTAAGQNFSLLVTPKKVTGKTIVLKATTASLSSREDSNDYQKTLITLINSMMQGESLEDYAYIPIKKPLKTNFHDIAEIKQLVIYSGERFLGIISAIKNKSKNLLSLKPSYFYKPGVRAIALSQQVIKPKETGLLYQVISQE